MLSLSEYQQQQRDRKRAAQAEHLQKCYDLLVQCADVEPALPPGNTSETPARQAWELERLRTRLELGDARLKPFCCDHCGVQLVVMGLQPRVIKERCQCPGCGWRGWVPL